MAATSVQSNNKLVKYTQEINREWVRGNAFSPYQGTSLNSIIRIRNELKNGGEQMNIPLVARLTGQGVGVGTLVGNEEKIDNYGMRVWLDWARNAVTVNKAERQKESADIFGEAKPLIDEEEESAWTKNRRVEFHIRNVEEAPPPPEAPKAKPDGDAPASPGE